MKTALGLLKLAHERFPTKHPANHYLRVATDKDPEHLAVMILTLYVGDKVWPFGLDEGDLVRDPGNILDEAARVIAKFGGQ